jgi:hypothetical protein
MAAIKFFTRSKVSQLVPVYLRFTDGRKTDIWIPTPYRMLPDYWNVKTQTFKQRVFFTDVFTETDAKDIEDKFTQLKDVILREHFTLTGPVTKEWLKAVIDKFYYKQTPGTENLNQYIKRFIAEAESGKRLCFSGNTKKVYSSGTLRSYRDFQRSFNLYQGIEEEPKKDKDGNYKKKRKPAKEWPKQPYKPLNFNDITIDFYNNFMQFFYDRNCGANYVGKHIKTLKTILRQSRDEGLHNNTEVERKAFKAISEPAESIYLTEEELNSLYKLDLSGSDTKHLEIARDVFLCGCYTAQRYSDYSRISKEMIKKYSGNKVIELIQQKTGEKCIIPIRPELDAILNKYDYTLPKTHEQKINKYIKEVGEQAGITEFINYEQNKGGLTVKTKVQKKELIKTHTARRSGCTLMYLAGIPIIDIMKVSGHKTEKEFLKYIKVGKEETAVNLSSHPYFKGKVLSIAK